MFLNNNRSTGPLQNYRLWQVLVPRREKFPRFGPENGLLCVTNGQIGKKWCVTHYRLIASLRVRLKRKFKFRLRCRVFLEGRPIVMKTAVTTI